MDTHILEKILNQKIIGIDILYDDGYDDAIMLCLENGKKIIIAAASSHSYGVLDIKEQFDASNIIS